MAVTVFGRCASRRSAALRAEPVALSQAKPAAAIASEFYIVDVRRDWNWRPYITLWRPRNAGYAYPLPWAGRYSHETVDGNAGYYYAKRYGCKRALDRFPVPCAVVERLAVMPAAGIIDGNTGPVLLNDAATRSALRKARYAPASADTRRMAETTKIGSVRSTGGAVPEGQTPLTSLPSESPSHDR